MGFWVIVPKRINLVGYGQSEEEKASEAIKLPWEKGVWGDVEDIASGVAAGSSG